MFKQEKINPYNAISTQYSIFSAIDNFMMVAS